MVGKEAPHFHLEKEWLIFCTGVVPGHLKCSAEADDSGGKGGTFDAGLQYLFQLSSQ